MNWTSISFPLVRLPLPTAMVEVASAGSSLGLLAHTVRDTLGQEWPNTVVRANLMVIVYMIVAVVAIEPLEGY